MYWMLRKLLDPVNNDRGFGIPSDLTELRRQLSLIPLKMDNEGRIMLPPKYKKSKSASTISEPSLTNIIGHSPDEADAVVLAVFALQSRDSKIRVGVL